jgi:hypothetical protein
MIFFKKTGDTAKSGDRTSQNVCAGDELTASLPVLVFWLFSFYPDNTPRNHCQSTDRSQRLHLPFSSHASGFFGGFLAGISRAMVFSRSDHQGETYLRYPGLFWALGHCGYHYALIRSNRSNLINGSSDFGFPQPNYPCNDWAVRRMRSPRCCVRGD